MGILQWTGLFVLLGAYTAVLAMGVLLSWPAGPAPWWQKLVEGYGLYFALWSALVVAIFGGNWVTRHRRRRIK